MSEISTVKQLCETIWALEKEFNLLDFEVQGVKVWQALRMPIYYTLAQQLGILSKPQPKMNDRKNNLKGLIPTLSSALLYNPFVANKKKDILIFDHPRKVLVDDNYIDIYSHYFIEQLRRADISFEVYEKSYLNKHLSTSDCHRKRIDFIDFIARIFSLLPVYRFSKVDSKHLMHVEKKIKATLGTELDIVVRFQKYVRKFLLQKVAYSKLFELKRPDAIYVIIGYTLAPIIKAAKCKGIEVIELQHGVFSDYHLGYSFPNTDPNSLDYFPDRFLIWDDFWRSMCNLPLEEEKIEVYGFEYIETHKNQYINAPKKNNQILVISQGAIGPALADIILENIDDLANYRLMYKLHPGECNRWQEYQSLVQLGNYENVSIIDNSNTPLYRLFAESKYVIGVFSTALFESLSFNCKLILLDLPGIEYMSKIIRSGKAVLIKKGNKIQAALETEK